VLGGFTTYSSFSYETLKLAEAGSWVGASLYVGLTTALCLVCCALGLSLGRVLVEGKGGW
jgi:CrcB protein